MTRTRRMGFWSMAIAFLSLALVAAGVENANSQNADCDRLRQAIADASNNSGAAQFQAAADRQQSEIDRMTAYARSIGCENHRFLFFGSAPPPQCGQITQQIARMSANLDDLRARAGGGAGGRGELIARFNSQCAGGPAKPANLFDALFGQPRPANPDVTVEPLTPDGQLANPPGEARAGSQAVCVRTCDGSFFPISYAASASRLDNLADMCRALCPNAEVSLYTYPSGGAIEEAVSMTGQRYVDSPNALKYRTSFDSSCSCKRKGESWAEALAGAEARLGPENRGDIIVTPQKSLELSRAKPDVKPDPKLKTAKGAKLPATPAAGADANGVDATLSAAAATISREASGIAGGADPGAHTIGESQGTTLEEVGPDGVKRRVRIVGPAL